MNYPIIKTTEALRSYMAEVSHKEVTDENLIWFVNIYNATMLADSYTTKDIAAMLQGGVEPTNKLEHVQPFLDTFYEDSEDEDYHKLQSLYLIKQVLRFYGKYELVGDVEAEIEELE